MPAEVHVPAKPTRLRPDRELVARLLASGGEDLKKCMQCATCSAVCELADASHPGPRKEMLWAQWGLHDRLMSDADVWLCHQCGDCTARCPRGARPGDVMAALRREQILHYASPRSLARWLARPASLPWLALVALGVVGLLALAWQAAGLAAAELGARGPRIVLPFWPRLPHGALVALFGLAVLFDVVVLVGGGRRFWRALQAASPATPMAHGLAPSWGRALRRILWHDEFGRCTARRARQTHHLLVAFGVAALGLASVWVLTARWNPLLDGLVYPFGLGNPWKLLANLGGLAVAVGVSLMLIERWRRPTTAGASRGFDLALLGFLLVIVLTGFASEVLHLWRIDGLRFAAYAVHLAAVLGLLMLLPYSKLAHGVYRTLAMVHAERIGRGRR